MEDRRRHAGPLQPIRRFEREGEAGVQGLGKRGHAAVIPLKLEVIQVGRHVQAIEPVVKFRGGAPDGGREGQIAYQDFAEPVPRLP
jgi:hypothetical protein